MRNRGFIVAVCLALGTIVWAQNSTPALSPLLAAQLQIAQLSDQLANAQLAAAGCQGQLKAVTDATVQAFSKQRYTEWIKACEETHVGYNCAQDGTLTKKADTK